MKITDEAVEAFTQYRRSQVAELRPWQSGDDMSGVSVSAEDAKAGSPKLGDMIARNPKNHADQWLVAAAYFADNFEPLATLPHLSQGAVSEDVDDVERHIDGLRLKAFKTNDPEVREAYFEACSKYFQDRHYRRLRAFADQKEDGDDTST